jgi:FixJ family two-component response regulator
VLDVAMPEIDGLQVQERFHQSGAELPVIFLPGHGDIPTSVRAVKAGAEDFLTKPVNAADLLQAVRAALQRASDQRAEQDALFGEAGMYFGGTADNNVEALIDT